VEIAQALDFVLERGMPGNGEVCHSPMGFLSKAMDSVLAAVDEQASENKAKSEREQLEAERLRLAVQADADVVLSAHG
jgi:hypothetical protein